MTPDDARALFASARVARLATVSPDGRPHVVPICFALAGADTILTAVDHKPKRTSALARLENIAADPAVAVLADHYADDWATLWWARADGTAAVGAVSDEALALLAARYEQYRTIPPAGPLVTITVERWSGWRATTSA